MNSASRFWAATPAPPTGPLTIAVTAFGFVPQGKMVRRSGARVGDAVYVTGSIGEAGGGLAIFKREKHSLSDAERDQLTARYRVPAAAGRVCGAPCARSPMPRSMSPTA